MVVVVVVVVPKVARIQGSNAGANTDADVVIIRF